MQVQMQVVDGRPRSMSWREKVTGGLWCSSSSQAGAYRPAPQDPRRLRRAHAPRVALVLCYSFLTRPSRLSSVVCDS